MLDDRIGVILLISNRISKTGGRNPRAAITIHPICAWSQKWTQGDSLLNQLQRREERGGCDARPGGWLITKIFDLCERSCVMSAYYISRTTINHRFVSFWNFLPLRARHCFEGTFWNGLFGMTGINGSLHRDATWTCPNN